MGSALVIGPLERSSGTGIRSRFCAYWNTLTEIYGAKYCSIKRVLKLNIVLLEFFFIEKFALD